MHNGFDVLLVEALRKRFYKADFVWVPLAALPDRENRLSGDKDERDDVDLVISNFSMTLERREKIDFAGPYFLDVQGLLTRTGNRTPNAKETTLCGLGSSTGEKTIKGLSWRLHQEPTLEKCIGMYERGEVAGVSTDMAILQPYVKDRAASEKPLPGTVVDLQALGTEEYGIGIPNNHPKLCAALNKAVEDFLRTSWEAAFRAFLTPAGVSPANRKPPGVEELSPLVRHSSRMIISQLGADLVGGGMAQLVEDFHGVLPGLPGTVRVARREVAVAEVGQRVGLSVPVAGRSEHGDRLLEADHCVGMVAEPGPDVAETVPGGRLARPVAQVVVQAEGLFAVGDGRLQPA